MGGRRGTRRANKKRRGSRSAPHHEGRRDQALLDERGAVPLQALLHPQEDGGVVPEHARGRWRGERRRVQAEVGADFRAEGSNVGQPVAEGGGVGEAGLAEEGAGRQEA